MAQKLFSKREKKAFPYFFMGALFLALAPFSLDYYKYAPAILVIAAIIFLVIGAWKLLKSSPKLLRSSSNEALDFDEMREVIEKIQSEIL